MRTIIAIGFTVVAQPGEWWHWIGAGVYIGVAVYMDVWSTDEPIRKE